MAIVQQLLTMFLMMFGSSCSDMPIAARYVPGHCPPTHSLGVSDAQTIDLPDPKSTPQEDDGLVDLNTATSTELERLPGVGPSLARRIIEYREKRLFERPSQLRRVRGIGPAKFAKVEPLVTVRGTPRE